MQVRAHARMLGNQGIVSGEEVEAMRGCAGGWMRGVG